MSAKVHDASCEGDWGSEGQESPCRCGESVPDGECDHSDFISRSIGGGMLRHTCNDCGETNDVSTADWWH